MYALKKYSLCFLILFLPAPAFSQKIYSGIIIDSVSFAELPSVIIRVKNSERRAISSLTGEFNIRANQTDTLILTMLGYKSMELPLQYEETEMLIRMSEHTRILDEITIRATRLYPNEIVNRTKVAPRRMSLLDGLGSPIDYLWKLEREKRKLARIVEENNRTQSYVQMITDPVVKDIIMKTYDLTELAYFEQIAIFNQQHRSISYSTEPEEIMDSLLAFFQAAKGKK